MNKSVLCGISGIILKARCEIPRFNFQFINLSLIILKLLRDIGYLVINSVESVSCLIKTYIIKIINKL